MKVAVVRDPEAPLGHAARCWLNCPCGAKPETRLDGYDIHCLCGATYTSNGLIRKARGEE